MSKILITGGTGFFGKNILKYILEQDSISSPFNQILVLTRDASKFKIDFPEFDSSSIQFLDGDIRSFLYEKSDLDYILHLATDASKELNDNHPLEMMDVIIEGTKNILRIAKNQRHLKKFIFTSSGAVYGSIPDEIMAVKETDRFDLDFNDPLNAYAQAKRTAEMMCSIYRIKHDLPILILRGFSFIGDYLPQDSHFAIGNFIKQAKENKKIVIRSDGSPRRSYMNACDMAKCVIDLLATPRSEDYIYNLGSDDGKSLKEWARWVADKVGDTEIQVLNESKIGYSAGTNYVPNIDRLKRDIDFTLNEPVI